MDTAESGETHNGAVFVNFQKEKMEKGECDQQNQSGRNELEHHRVQRRLHGVGTQIIKIFQIKPVELCTQKESSKECGAFPEDNFKGSGGDLSVCEDFANQHSCGGIEIEIQEREEGGFADWEKIAQQYV